jgi:nicotinic acid mononucleotide adenylyltransferase
LLAGSFNPLTRAHVALAEAARDAGRLDAILWVVTVSTVDKERVERASVVDRLLQMSAFVGAGTDTLALFNRGLYVEQSDVARTLFPQLEALLIVVGFDKIVQILDPHYYADRDAALDRLFGGASLLVAPRADQSEASLKALIGQEQNRRFEGRVAFCPLPGGYRSDSSSEIRRLAGDGVNSTRMGALAPPEGRALVEETGAYAVVAPRRVPVTASGDLYLLRQALIAHVAALDQDLVASAPRLERLIAACYDRLAVPVEVAEWLAQCGLTLGEFCVGYDGDARA